MKTNEKKTTVQPFGIKLLEVEAAKPVRIQTGLKGGLIGHIHSDDLRAFDDSGPTQFT